MKSRWLLIWALLVAVSLVGSVKAAAFDLNVVPDSVSLCQCSSITPENMKVSIRNLYEYPDTYTLSLEAPEGWRYQLQMNAALEPGEERELDLFLINIDCCVLPGTYTATLTAVSGMTGESISKDIKIEVLNCYDVDLKVEQKYQSVCAEKREPATYSVEVVNNGKFRETFQLSSDRDWVVFSQNTITLDSGESKTLEVIANPPEDLTGTHTITIYAKSTYSYAQASETLMMEVKSCYNFSARLEPKNQTICLGESAVFTLILGNLGIKSDTYKVFAPNWMVIEANQVSLGGNSVGETKLVAVPKEEGEREFDITVISTNVPELSKTIKGKLRVEDCSGVEITSEPGEIKVCREVPDTVEFVITVKNTGKVEDVFNLIATQGTLSTTKVFLEPEKSEDVVLSVDTEGINKTLEIVVTVSDRKISRNLTLKIIPETCFSAEMEVRPKDLSVCLCSSASFEVSVKNTGKLPDNFTLRFQSYFLNQTIPEFGLNPGESKTFTFGFNIPLRIDPGNYPIKAVAVSNHFVLEEEANLNIKEKGECYRVDMKAKEKVDGIKVVGGKKYLQECEAVTVPVSLRNSGLHNDTYNIWVNGPEWVYVTPTTLALSPGEEKEVYLYISPPFDSEGNYTINLTAKSFYTESKLKFEFSVVENATILEEVIEENLTQENITGVLPGVNISQPEENITGLVVGKESEWKILAVMLITLLIIIILLVRFVFLVRG